MVGEVVLVILHTVQRNVPHFILLILPPQERSQFLLNAFSRIAEEEHGVVEVGAFMGEFSGDTLYLAQFLNDELLVLAEGRVGEVLAVGDLVNRTEMPQGVIFSHSLPPHLYPRAATYFLNVEGMIDDLLADGYEM